MDENSSCENLHLENEPEKTTWRTPIEGQDKCLGSHGLFSDLWPLTSHLCHTESWEPTISTLRKEPNRLANFLSILRCYQEVHSCLPSRETLWVIAGRGLWGQAELRNLRNTEAALCSWLHWCSGRDTSQQPSPPTKPSSSLAETQNERSTSLESGVPPRWGDKPQPWIFMQGSLWTHPFQAVVLPELKP